MKPLSRWWPIVVLTLAAVAAIVGGAVWARGLCVGVLWGWAMPWAELACEDLEAGR